MRADSAPSTIGHGTRRAGAMELALSGPARRALDERGTPLHVELELYFSCLIRKRVRIVSQPHPDSVPLACDHSKLEVRLRPVTTRSCSMAEAGDHPELTTFPAQAPERFTPRWLRMDYRRGMWRGDFGY